ncbi:MAG TPA: AsnC family transcriptional regulator, partial [Thermoplasmata archaeon]|nr:AsnC family transcriptional regulator [Thermoplasmata archaeon]
HERRSPATMESVLRLEGVVTLLHYLEGWDIIAYAETDADLESTVEATRRITGATRVNWDVRSSTDYPPIPRTALSNLDVGIIGALLDDARIPFATLARRLGTSTKTAERRYKRLQNSGVISMLPGGGGPRSGMIMAYVLLEVPAARTQREKVVARLLALLPNNVMRNLAARSKVDFFLYCDSTVELENQMAAVRQVGGVGRVQFRVFTQQHRSPHFRQWLLRILREQAGKTG